MHIPTIDRILYATLGIGYKNTASSDDGNRILYRGKTKYSIRKMLSNYKFDVLESLNSKSV